jgi:hypothetical protein
VQCTARVRSASSGWLETSMPWFDITVVAISFAGIAALIAFLMLRGQ